MLERVVDVSVRTIGCRQRRVRAWISSDTTGPARLSLIVGRNRMRAFSLLLLFLGVLWLLAAPGLEIVSRRMELRRRPVYFYPYEQLSLEDVNTRIRDMWYSGIHRVYLYSLPGIVLFGSSAALALLSGRRVDKIQEKQ